jgi:hypothetical protein
MFKSKITAPIIIVLALAMPAISYAAAKYIPSAQVQANGKH